MSVQTAHGIWLQAQLPSAITITRYSMINGPNWAGGSANGFILLGSNDGSTWFYIDSESRSADFVWTTYNVAPGVAYQYYRLVITSSGYYYGMTNMLGFAVGDNSNYYPPYLSSPTDQGYVITNSSQWHTNGGSGTNWYYLTQNRPDQGWVTGQMLDYYGGYSPGGPYTGPETTSYTTPPVYSVPYAPTSLIAIGLNAHVVINFTPGSDGNYAITNYAYAISTDNVTFTSLTPFSPVTGIVNSVTINGLTNGTTYYIQLAAINSLGTGTASAPVSIVPDMPPVAPYNLTAVSGNHSATISFTPGDNGGNPITNYLYATSTDNVTFTSFTALSPPTGAVTSVTISGLSNGSITYIKLQAIASDNDNDNSGQEISPASVSVAVFPSGPPDPPTSLAWADTYNGTISVSFTPGFNEGSDITNYMYSLDGGANFTVFNPPQNSSPVTITGLTNRTHYTLELKAINLNGMASASTPLALYYMCFLEGTKITCYDATTQQEVERSIETLRKGDLVKTTMDGYKAIDTIGTSKLYNPANSMRSKNRLYRYSKENHPELKDDLVITGCHAVLVSDLSDQERRDLIDIQGKVYVTEDYYRLIACVDKRSIPYEKEGLFNIWHFALENDNYYFNYGVFANGMKVETASKRMMKEMSGMNLL